MVHTEFGVLGLFAPTYVWFIRATVLVGLAGASLSFPWPLARDWSGLVVLVCLGVQYVYTREFRARMRSALRTARLANAGDSIQSMAAVETRDLVEFLKDGKRELELGIKKLKRGDLKGSELALTHALTSYELGRTVAGQALACIRLNDLYRTFQLDDGQKAVAMRAQGIKESALRLSDDDEDKAFGLGLLGTLQEVRGDLEEAEELFQSALKLHTAKGRKTQEASCLKSLGDIYQKRGEPEVAKTYYERAKAVAA